MTRSLLTVLTCFILLISSCSTVKKTVAESEPPKTRTGTMPAPSKAKTFRKPLKIDRYEFVSFAKTLLGTPYKYGSANPDDGLDCSGFISFVFGHFNVKSPRSSVSFTNEGEDIDPDEARSGDIILFTGSDHASGIVGHMGIITKAGKPMQFIHSASGKNIGVILNSLTGYYKNHFVKVIRILE
ncbi:MAG: C40 family peptidase [Ferruginibacter sp.]